MIPVHRPRLAPLSTADLEPLARLLVPLLGDMGLLAPHGAAAVLAPAGAQFLALPPAARLARLVAAWEHAPRPDSWLVPLLTTTHGLNWPLFRRRLVAWADALPAGRLLDPTGLYAALEAAFGPLADAHTHSFRAVDRAPWQPRRAAAVWDATCQEPGGRREHTACTGGAQRVRPAGVAAVGKPASSPGRNSPPRPYAPRP